jgi:hypothetical protein
MTVVTMFYKILFWLFEFLLLVCRLKIFGFYTDELIALWGRKLLFKVEKTSVVSVLVDGSYRVKRVCYDPYIIELFLLNAKESTPLKVCVL